MQMSMKLHLEEKAWLFEGGLKESEKQWRPLGNLF